MATGAKYQEAAIAIGALALGVMALGGAIVFLGDKILKLMGLDMGRVLEIAGTVAAIVGVAAAIIAAGAVAFKCFSELEPKVKAIFIKKRKKTRNRSLSSLHISL